MTFRRDSLSCGILATVTNNNLVKRTVTFPAYTTQRIRISITRAAEGVSSVAELEAWGG